MTKKQDELLNSNYDGIQEYDNDLPRWWQALFLITILYGVGYVIYFYGGFRPSTQEKLQSELKAITDSKAALPTVQISSATLLAYAKDPSHLGAGKAVYQSKCMPCHGPEGQGLVGPNLTDDYWIHGGKSTDIRNTIEKGVLEKGMLAWKGVISDDEISDVAAFVFSLRGTTPSNPKAPQGEKYLGNE